MKFNEIWDYSKAPPYKEILCDILYLETMELTEKMTKSVCRNSPFFSELLH